MPDSDQSAFCGWFGSYRVGPEGKKYTGRFQKGCMIWQLYSPLDSFKRPVLQSDSLYQERGGLGGRLGSDGLLGGEGLLRRGGRLGREGLLGGEGRLRRGGLLGGEGRLWRGGRLR